MVLWYLVLTITIFHSLLLCAAAGCDLPRDRKQVQNLKYSESHSDLLCKPSTDILAHVMQICKDSAESDSVACAVHFRISSFLISSFPFLISPFLLLV